jgi:hypothetical protein
MDRESGVRAGYRLLLPLVAAVLLVCAACASVGGSGSETRSADRDDSMRTLRRSSIKIPPGERVLRSSEELVTLWEKNDIRGQMPEVDFSQRMVLVVSRGCHSNNCFGTRVRSFSPSGSGGTAWVEEINPHSECACSMVLTCPVHIVSVPRVEGDVEFRHRAVRANCRTVWRP